MNFYYKTLSISAILLFLTGCSKQLTFEELISDLPATTNSRTYSSSKMEYAISLPNELKLLEKDYDDTLFMELFIDSNIDFMKGSNYITVMKYQSKEKTLKAALKKLVSKRVKMKDFKVLSEGKTNFLSGQAYYEHASYPISKKDRESIIFLIKGKSSDFYAVSVETGKENNYPRSMKRLLACVKTFRMLETAEQSPSE